MKSTYCISIALTLGAIATQSTIAQAIAPAEVARIARGVTVRVESQNPGSGILIQQSGNTYTVLTAAHVVATDDFYEVVTPDKSRHTIQNATIQKFPGVDLAIFTFNSPQTYRVAQFGDSHQSKVGTPCYVSLFHHSRQIKIL